VLNRSHILSVAVERLKRRRRGEERGGERLYGVETGVRNRAVNRNTPRFPPDRPDATTPKAGLGRRAMNTLPSIEYNSLPEPP